MENEYIEKEIKLKIEDHQKIIGYLTSHGAHLLNKSMEKTVRFDTPGSELERKGIFLRVRSGSKNTITMKEKIGTDKNVRSRKETEFVIENIEAMKYILGKLGFTNTKIMEKYRINWLYKNTKLSLDELPFGIFLEIEGDERGINTVMEELGFSEKDKILKTYWDLLDENEAPTTSRSGYLLPAASSGAESLRSRNSSHSPMALRPWYSAKGDSKEGGKKDKNIMFPKDYKFKLMRI